MTTKDLTIDMFKVEDYGQLDRPTGVGFDRFTDVNELNILKALQMAGSARSIFIDGKLVAIAGAMDRWAGVCEVFFMPDKSWVKNKKSLCRMLKWHIAFLFKYYHRIQLVCLNNQRYRRFAEFLGFVEEGILHRYDKLGADYVMYAVTNGGRNG